MEELSSDQSGPICEWAFRCSYHKKIALVKPFSQSQQIDLSRDSELSLQRKCVKCCLKLRIFLASEKNIKFQEKLGRDFQFQWIPVSKHPVSFMFPDTPALHYFLRITF